MAIAAKVEGVERVLAALKQLARERISENCVVGYTAAYALWVHENRAMKWRGYPRDRSVRRSDEGGQTIARTGFAASQGKGLFWGPKGRAGFLLDVAREMSSELGQMVFKGLKRGLTVGKALLLAGLRLQRESQLNVPVEFGALRASAFTRLE